MTKTENYILAGDIMLNAESVVSWVQTCNNYVGQRREMAVDNALRSLADLEKAVKSLKEELKDQL
jgi:hypothetical protein